MINQIINHQGNSYIVRYTKSVSSFTKNNVISTDSINSWRMALECDQVIIEQDRVLFLQRIQDAEIVE